MKAWIDRNLRYIAILLPTVATLLQTMAQVFQWHLPWNPRAFELLVSVLYILIFIILYRRTPQVRIAFHNIFARGITWLFLGQLVLIAWLAFITLLVLMLAEAVSNLSATATSVAVTETIGAGSPSSTSTSTPTAYLADAFGSAPSTGGTWEALSCLPGAISHRFDRVRIALESSESGPEISCNLVARLRNASPVRIVARLTLQDGTAGLAYAGIISSCGGPYANFLLSPGSVIISRSGERQQDLTFYTDLPVTKTIQIEWLEGFMSFTVLEDHVTTTLPCSQAANYVKIGAFTTAGGSVVADFLDFTLWASTATPTP